MARKTTTAQPEHELPDTKPDQWHAVGWMIANIQKALPVVKTAAAKLKESQFTDDGARACFIAVRESVGLDGPSFADVTRHLRQIVQGDGGNLEAVRGKLGEVVADVATAHRRTLDEAVAALREADRQRDFLEWQRVHATALPTPQGMGRAFAELRDIMHEEPEEREAPKTDALSIADRWATATEERVIRTGFLPFDKRFNGGLPTGITAITAQPGVGKSAFAGQIMLGALLENPKLRAVWFRWEMSESLLWTKFLATWSTLRGGCVTRIGRKQAARRDASAMKVNADLAATVGERLHIVSPPMTPERMRSVLEEHNADLVVFDYLQKLRAEGFQDKRAEIDHVLAVISEVTTARDIATIVVSAMAGSSTKVTPPIGAMTKESNKLDYDAHNYVTLWCVENDKDKDPRPVRMDIIKGRTGGEGSVDLTFTGSGQFFHPVSDDYIEHDVEPDPAFLSHALEQFA
jgi:replicative DNA helicase